MNTEKVWSGRTSHWKLEERNRFLPVAAKRNVALLTLDFSIIVILLEAGFSELNTFGTESRTLKDKEMGVCLILFCLSFLNYIYTLQASLLWFNPWVRYFLEYLTYS